jgi:hypothetical protein
MVIKMNDDKILNLLYAALEDQDIWFTTKNDPTYAEAPSYYKLNEYGELTKEAKKQIVKDIKSYIGDGAVDEVDAVDMWVNENLANYKIAFKDTLVTKFKQKPVVDQIDAYEVPVENKSNNLNEVKLPGMLTDMDDDLYNSLQNQTMPNWTDEDWDNYYKSFYNSRIEIYQNPEIPDNIKLNNLEQDAKNYNLKDLNFDKEHYKDSISKLSVAYADEKKRQYEFAKNFEKKTENVKARLKEENDKSANVISAMFTSSDFDADSKDGKIVIKTSDLFNTLSDKGYDVQVAFDNGESQSVILLGDQGGQINVTINNPDQPLRAFASGNFEITQDNLRTMEDVLNLIKNVK